MNKKKISLLILALLIIIGIIIAVYRNNSVISPSLVNREYSITTPEGWKRYENKEWGFTFSYPASWTLEEHHLTQKDLDMSGSNAPVGQFSGVTLSGDGYRINFDYSGSGLSDEYAYTYPEYTIARTKVKAIKYETDSRFGLFLNVPLKNSLTKVKTLVIRVSNTDPKVKYAPIIDQFLSTIEVP